MVQSVVRIKEMAKNKQTNDDYESEGLGFESLRAHHLKPLEFQRSEGFYFVLKDIANGGYWGSMVVHGVVQMWYG